MKMLAALATGGLSLWSFPAQADFVNGIYGIRANGEIVLRGHQISSTTGAPVAWSIAWSLDPPGAHWDTYLFAFAGAPGAVYGINRQGGLLLHRHELGTDDAGVYRWNSRNQPVGGGSWNYKHVFAGFGGAIYGIKNNGDLWFYRHDPNDPFNWPAQGRKIDSGWNFKQVFAGDYESLYGIRENGDMIFFRLRRTGGDSPRWSIRNKKVGNGWHFKHVFAGPEGTVYAIRDNGDVLYYLHAGHQSGTADWPIQAVKIASGWDFKRVFAARQMWCTRCWVHPREPSP